MTIRRSHAVRATALGALVGALVLAAGCGQGDDGPAGAATTAPTTTSTTVSYPWLEQPDGAPALDKVSPLPSLVFPPGVDYPTALEELYVSVQHGTLPKGAELAEPLPSEVVIVRPTGSGRGLQLSLTAPWGWTEDTGLIRAPSIGFPGMTSKEASEAYARARATGEAIPDGARVDVPELPACQVALGTSDRRPPCS